MITKMLDSIRGKPDGNDGVDNVKEEGGDDVKVYVSSNGSLYVKAHELAHSRAWREKVKKLRDADLTGRNRQVRDG